MTAVDIIALFLKQFILSFIPLFIAVDAPGVLPIILGLTEGMEKAEQSKMLRYAILTALGLGLGFVALGKLIFAVLGILESHFLVAGGLVLLLFSARNLLDTERGEAARRTTADTVGVFPVGVPLLVGPAVLTTLLVLVDRYAIAPVTLAFLLNLALAWIVIREAPRVARLMGKGGLGAASKIAMLLLATIAVRMVHLGVVQLVANGLAVP